MTLLPGESETFLGHREWRARLQPKSFTSDCRPTSHFYRHTALEKNFIPFSLKPTHTKIKYLPKWVQNSNWSFTGRHIGKWFFISLLWMREFSVLTCPPNEQALMSNNRAIHPSIHLAVQDWCKCQANDQTTPPYTHSLHKIPKSFPRHKASQASSEDKQPYQWKCSKKKKKETRGVDQRNKHA